MKSLSLVLAVMLGVFAAIGTAQADVMRVVVSEVSDAPAYLKALDKIRAGLKRLGSKATIHGYRARFAGPNAGHVVVTVDYADMAAFAADDSKMGNDAEMQATLKEMGQYRKIISDSLYEDLK